MLKLGLFLAIIIACFRRLGRVLTAQSSKARLPHFFVWAIGVSLFAHCISFLSITYFDQIIIIWFWLLAIIVSLPIIKKPSFGMARKLSGESPIATNVNIDRLRTLKSLVSIGP